MINLANLSLLPPVIGTCQKCGTIHKPDEPHNAQSVFYQTLFQMKYGRAPTWDDAMTHCNVAVQERWKTSLVGAGIDVAAGQLSPPEATHHE